MALSDEGEPKGIQTFLTAWGEILGEHQGNRFSGSIQIPVLAFRQQIYIWRPSDKNRKGLALTACEALQELWKDLRQFAGGRLFAV